MTLTQELEAKGYPANLPADGEFHRFHRNRSGGQPNGWFRATMLKVGQKQAISATFGDWATGEKHNYLQLEGEFSPAESKELADKVAADQAEQLRQRKGREEDTALSCEKWYADSFESGSTAYLTKKKLPRVEELGCRIDVDDTSTLLVPAYDEAGKLWNCQRILKDGSKYFTKGARIKGCFFTFPAKGKDEGLVYVAEGFATAASVHLATGRKTFSAFNSGNLARVAHLARQLHPEATIVVCGDDDRFTTRPGAGPWNPGREAAVAAAALCAGSVHLPVFEDLSSKPTDWNDLHCARGIAEVTRQLTSPPPEVPQAAGATESLVGNPTENNGVTDPTSSPIPDDAYPISEPAPEPKMGDLWYGLKSLPIKKNKEGKILIPPQQAVVEHLLRWAGDRLVKQDRDLFEYVGTHWRHLEPGDHDRIRQAIQHSCSGLATMSMVDAVYRLLVVHLESPGEGVDLFTPNPFCANMKNGSLWVVQDKARRTFDLEFRPHRQADWLVNVLQFAYLPDDKSENAEFLGMLDRVYAGDADKEQKILATGEMYGSLLVPLFPHLFMCWGGAGTGKSTVLNIAARLVHKDNLCSVAPSEFVGFNMESMAGKLVNIDTDIPLSEPIRDEIVKKIIDRRPFRIRRKGIKDLYAPIPAVHLFGGNSIPRTLDGASRAHDRRWTFLGFHHPVPKGDYSIDYWDWCFEQNPQGVLNFALAGLKRLLAQRGMFTNPDSGKAKMEQWQINSDVVGQFLRDIKEGETIAKFTQVSTENNGVVERKQLWETFRVWHEEVHSRKPSIGRSRFYESLEATGIVVKTIQGVRYFCGLQPGSGAGAKF